MNFLSIFVLIPLLMLAGLWAARGIKAIRGVMVTGASALLIASVVLTFLYLGERSAGNTAEMLFRADTLWYAPLHISYSVGVDGISVAMLLLSAVIVFTGTFASWRLQPLTKEYFLWFTLLSMGTRCIAVQKVCCATVRFQEDSWSLLPNQNRFREYRSAGRQNHPST